MTDFRNIIVNIINPQTIVPIGKHGRRERTPINCDKHERCKITPINCDKHKHKMVLYGYRDFAKTLYFSVSLKTL